MSDDVAAGDGGTVDVGGQVPWMPPPPHGTKDGWHVLIVRDVPEDDDLDEHGQDRYELLHPHGCPARIHSLGGMDYECHTSTDIANGGFYGMFERDETLRPGVWLIHPWVEKDRGADWVEYDGGWTVIRLSEAPYDLLPAASGEGSDR